MTLSSRFTTPAAELDLRRLMWKTGMTAVVSLCIALLVHASLMSVRGLAKESASVRPLTTQFVKRAPRLTKPLELKKRPQPKRRQVQRTMVSVKARGVTQEARTSISGHDVAGKLARPRVEMVRSTGLTTGLVEPQALAQAVQGSKESQYTLDMSLEMMDIRALDTGRYHAMVVQDPQDKRNLKGFCHLAIVYSKALYPPPSYYGWDPEYAFETYILPGFLELPTIMNKFTDINTDILGRVGVDDSEIFKAPWVFFEGRVSFRLTQGELENLGRYLMAGGLVFADCSNHHPYNHPSSGYTALRSNLLDALATQGVKGKFDTLPDDHPVYHCYFDFDGPPIGVEAYFLGRGFTQIVLRYLEGVHIDGRLSVLLSGKFYVETWKRPYANQPDWARAKQFTVNTIVFALTQEGSITHRLMGNVQ